MKLPEGLKIPQLKVVAISDTHGKHDELALPPGDLLIHAGDITMNGEEKDVINFLNWFKEQEYKHKILIAGNHDFYFERAPLEVINQLIPPGIVYLEDSMAIVGGLKIWGSPVTPWFFNWAFNRNRGEAIQQHWNKIPFDTDILITHGPAFRRLDKASNGKHVGCKDLFNRIYDAKPKVHICGHIHESYGVKDEVSIKFINASVSNAKYEMVNTPIVFEL